MDSTERMRPSEYIYKALFLNGVGSDVKLHMLGEEWNLHRVYLCQSPFFSNMFPAVWNDENEEVTIDITDPHITREGLKFVLGSLYTDETEINLDELLSIFGAAKLFQLNAIVDNCMEVMTKSINVHTVLDFYEAGRYYELAEMTESCKNWLLANLLYRIPDHPVILREMEAEMLAELISSPDLIVLNMEFAIYVLLKMWLFLKKNRVWIGNRSTCFFEADRYFQSRPQGTCYLQSTEGEAFALPFTLLRLQHLINHPLDLQMLERDRIIPSGWLLPVFRIQWYHLVRTDQGGDKGPNGTTLESFNNLCFRCGRKLLVNKQCSWRWTGFNFGIYLIVTYDQSKRLLKFKRNIQSDGIDQGCVSRQAKRAICYRVTVVSIDDEGHVLHTKSTGLKTAKLSRNEEIRVLKLNPAITFPLILSANFLLISPRPRESSELVRPRPFISAW